MNHRLIYTFAPLVALSSAFTSPAASANELVNPSFELPSFFGWSTFNNTFPTSDPNDPARTGVGSGLVLGPFFNLPNASGIFQDISPTTGAVYEGSIWLHNESVNNDGNADNILGTNNVVSLAIEWVDNGNTTRVAEEVIFDGQDPNLPLDVWVQGSVLSPAAPAGIDAVRLVLLFVQPPTFDGGVVFFDDASLAVIPEPAALGIAALGCFVVAGRWRR